MDEEFIIEEKIVSVKLTKQEIKDEIDMLQTEVENYKVSIDIKLNKIKELKDKLKLFKR